MHSKRAGPAGRHKTPKKQMYSLFFNSLIHLKNFALRIIIKVIALHYVPYESIIFGIQN